MQRSLLRRSSSLAMLGDSLIAAGRTGLLAVQHGTGLPWWATIVGTTLGLRLSLTLPLAVYQQRKLARLELLIPQIKQQAEQLRDQLVVQAKRQGLSRAQAEGAVQRKVLQHNAKFRAEHGLQIWKMQAPLYAQIPIWITLSLSLRDMCSMDADIHGVVSAEIHGLSTGGLAFIDNLAVPDPTLGLPILLGLAAYTNVEFNALKAGEKTRGQELLTSFFRYLALLMIPIAAYVPAGVTLYWSTSTLFGLVQTIALRYPGVRRKLGIAATPTESSTPILNAVQLARANLSGFWKDVREKNFARNNAGSSVSPPARPAASAGHANDKQQQQPTPVPSTPALKASRQDLGSLRAPPRRQAPAAGGKD